jgi:hypothetical protein
MRDNGPEYMTDAALDAEIARQVAVDPSPAFVPRIRQRAAAEEIAPRSSLWSLWSLWSMPRLAVAGIVVAAAVAAVAAVIGSRVQPRLDTARSAALATVATPPLTAHALPVARVPAIAPAVAIGAGRVARARRPATHKADTGPEILIDRREARAMRALLDDVASNRRDVAALLAEALAPDLDDGPPRDIEIAPIDLPALTGGASQPASD